MRFLFVFALAFISLSSAWANIIYVRQDGTGDYLTIGQAINSSNSSDFIIVGPGTYTESFQISSNLVLVSEQGRESTILKNDGAMRLCFVDYSGEVHLSGFTFDGIVGDMANAIFGFGEVYVNDCIFQNWEGRPQYNEAPVVTHNTAIFSRCVFQDNSFMSFCGTGDNIEISFCQFLRNEGGNKSAAIYIDYSYDFEIYNCIFNDNDAFMGIVFVMHGDGNVRNNTFYNNRSESGSVYFSHVSGEFNNNIVSFGMSFGLNLVNSATSFVGCNIFWENSGGDISDQSCIPGNIFLNPGFCDPDYGDLTVWDYSPAAWISDGCAFIGALPIGCWGPITVDTQTWGTLKCQFR